MDTGTSSSNESGLCGVILAAGRGSRISAWSRWLPKALLPIGGRPILSYQIGLLRSAGIREVYVVVGHLGEIIVDYLEAVHGLGVEVRFSQQRELRGSGHALLTLEPKIGGPFVMFLGDIFIAPGDFNLIVDPIRAGACEAVLAVADEDDPASLRKNFSVAVTEDGLVTRVVEKPKLDAPGLKGCGIYSFTPAIFGALKQTPASGNGEVGITDGIQTLIDIGGLVRTAAVSRWDMNVTTGEDLARCDEYLAAAG